MKRVITLLLALFLVSLPASHAQAAGVSYVGGAEKFIFTSGSEQYPTDLFADFKDVMPGDTITEQILIKNDAADKVDIKVYLRSLGAQEQTKDFLSQLKLTVQQKDASVLFAAPADETAQLTDWVYLGTVYSGGEIALDVTLEVPITLDNEFQKKVGYVDWEFKIEELPKESSDSDDSTEPSEPFVPKLPQTGDNSNIFRYAGLVIFSLAAIIVLFFARKRRKQEE